jgi:twitching motility two-component system response regulator PilG
LSSVNWQKFVTQCQFSLQNWQKLTPHIYSSYQRLYFFNNTYAKQNLSAQHQEQLGKVLRGFNFRHLAALLNQDELVLAQKLYPLIVNGAILLRDPQLPFKLLPKLTSNSSATSKDRTILKNPPQENLLSGFIDPKSPTPKPASKKCKIACVDDSQTILNEIKRFLDDDFSVVTIDDPLSALMKMMQIKPDLILVDLKMPKLDGYQLCSMLRKSSLFKKTPIIMVTGKKGLIDRARAKLSGANDYLTKPFTKSELLDVVNRHLN